MPAPRWFLPIFILLLHVSHACCQALLEEPAIHPDEGLQQLHWTDAEKAVGEVAFISGKIIDVGSSGRVNFLNFDTKRPPDFTGIIFRENLDNFPEPLKETYLNKIARIRGVVSRYQDKPQIVITHPDQIEILDELPDTTVPVQRSEKQRPEGHIVLATYNILNLFDSEDDPYHADEGTRPKPRTELQYLAQSLATLDADLVAMQEVENRGYLERFVNVFLPDLGYDHVVHFEGNDLRGIDVCLISRLPIGPVRSHRHLRFTGPEGEVRKFNRDVIAVTVEPPGGQSFDVWVVHLKSNSGGREFAEPVRLAEAEELRRLLDEELEQNPDARFVVMGDFNDTWDSKTLQTIVGSGDNKLWSVASDSLSEETVTYNTGQYRSMIDFILCSPAMAEDYVKGSARVIAGSPETTGSDHNPVAATFELD